MFCVMDNYPMALLLSAALTCAVARKKCVKHMVLKCAANGGEVRKTAIEIKCFPLVRWQGDQANVCSQILTVYFREVESKEKWGALLRMGSAASQGSELSTKVSRKRRCEEMLRTITIIREGIFSVICLKCSWFFLEQGTVNILDGYRTPPFT